MTTRQAWEAELFFGFRAFAWQILQASTAFHPHRLGEDFPDSGAHSDWGFFPFFVFFWLGVLFWGFFLGGVGLGAVSYKWDWGTFCFSLCFLLWSWGAEVSNGWFCLCITC